MRKTDTSRVGCVCFFALGGRRLCRCYAFNVEGKKRYAFTVGWLWRFAVGIAEWWYRFLV